MQLDLEGVHILSARISTAVLPIANELIFASFDMEALLDAVPTTKAWLQLIFSTIGRMKKQNFLEDKI